ncbi:U-scoloptoxin(01)-Cw1a [Dermacentor silvarum]|uniref:U-scoloptoxin(01)-Cw1a n=1 Tax=Dermacentor silvarum TaxID=543639 RepID=UPI00210112F9|nr:U-scoloptoxin(01)-Cw1a [Dermacentor silvarum]XP_049522138.1 U-scoloptoxin(01)-Cw1a [Dermacentor silvarum]
MKVAAAVLLLAAVVAAVPRTRRQAAPLPDGIELLLGRALQSSFQCTRDGYYADVETNCQVFHVCRGVTKENGNVEFEHHAFACGNQTVFNQASFTCAFLDEAIPCNSAKDFFYLNERLFQDKDTPILGDDDAQKAAEFYPARAAAAKA